MESFNPARLTLARKCRGLSMVGLAEALDIDPRSVTAYERGEFPPDHDKLLRIGEILRFPVTFFMGEHVESISPDMASFRSLSRMRASQRDIALGMGSIARLVNTWIEKRFELPSSDLPDLGRERDPETAAETLRRIWGLGERAVKNTIHLLEARGIRVFSLNIDSTDVDAFSMWNDNTPFVFLNTRKSAEHSRFDAAHELGHLVMHRHGLPQGRDIEKEANSFASAFLMPAALVRSKAPAFVTVDNLVRLKKHWIVSVAALAYRLRVLGILSEWHYRNVSIEIAKRGYRTSEPEEAPRETSQIFAKVFSALKIEGESKNNIAKDLRITVNELDSLLFGLALTSMMGGKSKAKPSERTMRPGSLRLVKEGR